MKFFSYIFLLFYLFYTPFSFAIDLNIYEGDEYWEKVNTLNWLQGPRSIKHKNQGIIHLNENQQALIGEDARQMIYWINGMEFNIDVFVQDLYSYTDYSFNDSGYVELDDWKDVNPDKFLKELNSGREEGNKERASKGFDTILSNVWFREPTLNKEKNTVSYATDVTFSDNTHSINAALLILGRYGYAEATIVASIEEFNLSGNEMLDAVIANYDFVEQKKYTNFSTGDKVAAAGIGGLLAASMGIKAFKAGGIAALLILLKKGGFLLFLPFIFAWGWIKRLFTRKE